MKIINVRKSRISPDKVLNGTVVNQLCSSVKGEPHLSMKSEIAIIRLVTV